MAQDIPGRHVLGSGEAHLPGDVVAQWFEYADATGHVMIVGPDGTVIGTSDSGLQETAGIIQQKPEPDLLGHGEKHGPKVYRRWGN
ncbi:MAG: hypothetical protein ACLQIQ_08685 [Beijerinckiaceae bacterium]